MAKHNLDLSIVNDGSVYETRKKLAFIALAEGPKCDYYAALKNQVVIPAVNEARKQFGDKFSLKDIKEVVHEVMAYDKNLAIELIKDAYQDNPTISAYAREWFDAYNGNSYHSVILHIAGYKVYIPMQYGYGDQWKYSAYDWLTTNGIIAKKERKNGIEARDLDIIQFGKITRGNKSEL